MYSMAGDLMAKSVGESKARVKQTDTKDAH